MPSLSQCMMFHVKIAKHHTDRKHACNLLLAAEVEKQKAALEAAAEQLLTANTAMTDQRGQFDQQTAELRGQLAFKTSELTDAQQHGEVLQGQLAAAQEGRQQAEQYCQVCEARPNWYSSSI